MDLRRSLVRESVPWSAALAALPNAHLLQSWEWGEFKAAYGWEAERMLWSAADGRPVAAAQVLARRIRVPVWGLSRSVLYVPRGPALDWRDHALADHVLGELAALSTGPGVLQVKIDPDTPLGYGLPDSPKAESNPAGSALEARLPALGFRPSPEQVQFRNTFVLDLRPGEDRLLAAMKQKTRYNVRLAERHGVRVRPVAQDAIPLLYQMYAETSVRDGFVIR